MRGALFALFTFLLAAVPAAASETFAKRVELLKAERQLLLIGPDDEVLRRYHVALGGAPEGHKQREGDERTPEGHYVIDWRNPNSTYHLSLHISYPNAEDRRRAASKGEDPGGMIMIHGLAEGMEWIGPLHRMWDWTNGCVAVTNFEIEEIWSLVRNGTPIHIMP